MTLPGSDMLRHSFPEQYERCLVGPLFRPWAEVLVERARLTAGARLLDLACGTGIVGRLAQEVVGGDGRIVGIDASAPMLAVARAIAPEIRWREGRAEALPLEDGEQFDVVICHQGLQFFPDKPAAAREMRRALAPGGRVAVGTWRPLEEVPLFAALHAVAIRRLGPIHDQRHSYGDPTAISTLLRGAGFRNPQVEILTRALHFPDGEILVRLNAMALLSMSGAGKALSEDDRMELVGTLVREGWEAVAPFRDGVALTFDIASTVAVATC